MKKLMIQLVKFGIVGIIATVIDFCVLIFICFYCINKQHCSCHGAYSARNRSNQNIFIIIKNFKR